MDTPHLPDNEIEEITWQDDENRATLFLRSVFVLFSGALILGALMKTTTTGIFAQFLVVVGLLIIFPVLIIWLFFGQGLRPVEWLTDQKYNAWNYGFNFKDWKSHLKGSFFLIVLGLILTIIHQFILLIPFSSNSHFQQWPFVVTLVWLASICFVWFFWGYIWFGCSQGFGPVLATIFTMILAISALTFTLGNKQNLEMIVYVALIFSLSGYLCWKHRSFAPVLYAMFFIAPIAIPILLSSF